MATSATPNQKLINTASVVERTQFRQRNECRFSRFKQDAILDRKSTWKAFKISALNDPSMNNRNQWWRFTREYFHSTPYQRPASYAPARAQSHRHRFVHLALGMDKRAWATVASTEAARRFQVQRPCHRTTLSLLRFIFDAHGKSLLECYNPSMPMSQLIESCSAANAASDIAHLWLSSEGKTVSGLAP
ncbi:uncharacterized protein LW94_9654 [Fusarium fujikuroi]|nr:uncharacterized protein LW94_9654 [Fusarium fujikuroi]SCO27287.1 uncharacterized protein FFMR_00166 [Fusarium fujikuroi]